MMHRRTLFIWGLMSAVACTENASNGDGNGRMPVDPGIFSRLGEPRANATAEERAVFERGEAIALHRFSEAEGLGGPGFNLTFCTGCHEKPAFGGSGPRYRNFFLTATIDINGNYQPLPTNGVQRTYSAGGYVPTSSAAETFATRNGIPFFGVGLMDEIYESSILANEDPNDEDGDGISGVANIVNGVVGRYGRKAQTDNIEGFIRGPMFNHMGVTSHPLTVEQRLRLPSQRVRELFEPSSMTSGLSRGSGFGRTGHGQAVAPDEPVVDFDDVPDPEMQGDELFDLVAWAMLLGAPRPEPLDDETRAGKALFEQANCTGCHVEQLDGRRGGVPLYSDLLLHDMGPELADGVVMEDASGSEFRTQPLWGIGAMAPYLHDGRADTLDDAIRMHGGEGQASRDAYVAMSDGDRGRIIAFLESLGGMDQSTGGLLTPDDLQAPPAGAPSGPVPGLTPDEIALFERGRIFFDRDFGLGEGLGPKFNGDSCRACHFDPVIGGSGPAGVNVVRHGVWSGDEFQVPDVNHTIVHRFLADTKQRPPAGTGANVFELRQTPPMFGLGLLEQIPQSFLESLEDPDDTKTPDGITGRVHRLPGGRIGRLGWKLDIPSVQEFVRDALSNEMGVTLPDQPGAVFGFATDDDALPDPEVSMEDMQALIFFAEKMAPLAPRSTDPQAEARGEALFVQVGCDGCHVPSLPLEDGGQIAAYTDLLLHDVAPEGYRGVPAGDASGREFRTTPLWGLGQTGPYMHHGRAATIVDAILEHGAEASASRDAFSGLTLEEQDDLLAFLRSL